MKALEGKEIKNKLASTPGWNYQNDFIEREIQFPSFKEAISFLNKIADIAEHINHHPNLTNSYNKLLIQLRTHDVQGISQKDFKLAKLINQLYLETTN